uniref:Uncharacterized protein n=1 Tax=Panagrolaimus superbus TaxID=310955 RepID=A0A914Z7I6_9BILA
MLVERTKTIRPKSVVFISTYDIAVVKRWFEVRYRGIIHYMVEKPDYMLLNGGLAKAGTMYPGNHFPRPFNIQDFSSGYKIEYTNDDGKFCDDLISFNSKLPSKNTVELVKIKSFCVRYHQEITVAPVVPPLLAYGRFQGAILYENTRAKSVTITANINSHGVPYMKLDPKFFN